MINYGRFDIDKFTGANDFALWKIKMEAILTQQGVEMALLPRSEVPATITDHELKILSGKARSTIILSLGDEPLREVAKEKTAVDMWKKLESLYQTRSLARRLFMKSQLYSYRMDPDRNILEQLAMFNKTLDEIDSIEDSKLPDEDKAIILLNSLPKSYESIRDAIAFTGQKKVTLEEVQCLIRQKEQQKETAKVEASGEGLMVKNNNYKPKFQP